MPAVGQKPARDGASSPNQDCKRVKVEGVEASVAETPPLADLPVDPSASAPRKPVQPTLFTVSSALLYSAALGLQGRLDNGIC